jgi:hypothetical protein
MTAERSFYQLAKRDLVEPDIHGNDMGRDPRKIARDVLAQYFGQNVSIVRASVLTRPRNAPCLVAHFGRSAWEPTRTGIRPTMLAAASGNPERLKLPASSRCHPLPGYRTPQHDADPKRFPDAGYFGKQLQGDSWRNWRAVLLAVAGEELAPEVCRLVPQEAVDVGKVIATLVLVTLTGRIVAGSEPDEAAEAANAEKVMLSPLPTPPPVTALEIVTVVEVLLETVVLAGMTLGVVTSRTVMPTRTQDGTDVKVSVVPDEVAALVATAPATWIRA